jgi:hypothetical protein
MSETKNTKPTHTAYQVREGKNGSFWTKVGSAWQHLDGKGFSINLDAIPVDGRITLRSVKEKVASSEEA